MTVSIPCGEKNISPFPKRIFVNGRRYTNFAFKTKKNLINADSY